MSRTFRCCRDILDQHCLVERFNAPLREQIPKITRTFLKLSRLRVRNLSVYQTYAFHHQRSMALIGPGPKIVTGIWSLPHRVCRRCDEHFVWPRHRIYGDLRVSRKSHSPFLSIIPGLVSIVMAWPRKHEASAFIEVTKPVRTRLPSYGSSQTSRHILSPEGRSWPCPFLIRKKATQVLEDESRAGRARLMSLLLVMNEKDYAGSRVMAKEALCLLLLSADGLNCRTAYQTHVEGF